MDACFIDIKMMGSKNRGKSYDLMELYYKKMVKHKIKSFSRQSFGFYHHNYLVFDTPQPDVSTTRLNPGLNPEDNEAVIEFLNSIDTKRFK